MESALAHLMLAERMFVAQGNRRGQAKSLHNQGETYLRQERWSEAGDLYERAIALAQEVGDDVGAVRSRISLAILLHQQGQHEAALEMHREIKILYRRLGDRPMLARVINNEGSFLLAFGQVGGSCPGLRTGCTNAPRDWSSRRRCGLTPQLV